MTSTDSPLKVTELALQRLVQYMRDQLPNEGCGFLVGPKSEDFADRWWPVPNIDPEPKKGYTMPNDKVTAAYAACDMQNLEVRAAVHSHPTTWPLMSQRDLDDAVDLTPAYAIVAWNSGVPKIRAYRVSLGSIGVKNVHEVEIIPGSAEGLRSGPAIPVVPWALTVGNRVAITYQRGHATSTATVTGRVMGAGPDEVSLEGVPTNQPASVVMERIRKVHLLAESEPAQRLRREMIGHARHVAASAASGPALAEVPRLVAALSAAFPVDIEITIEES